MQNEQSFTIRESDPLILIISGLSGAGKDSVINRLREKGLFDFHFIVTCNTRAPRADEVDGKDYHFVSRERFLEMVSNGEMLEYSPVYDDYKGVPRFEVEAGFREGKDLIMRLDFQGMQKVKKVYPDAVSVFIIPPDSETWVGRLRKRNTDTEDSLRLRIQTAAKEISVASGFDYIVVNDDLDRAAEELASIIRAEHASSSRRRIITG